MRAVETDRLDVFVGRERAGLLLRNREGSEFRYRDDYPRDAIRGVAFAIPPTRRSVITRGINLHPFFAGLLPEGLRLSVLVRQVKTSIDDLFSLLAAIGSDCIGDISVVPEGEVLEDRTELVDLSRPEDLDFGALLQESLDPEATTLDLSIPGVQEKLSAAMISLPVRAKSGTTSYILKLDPHDRPKLVANEGFFMRMARDCGLKAAEVRLVADGRGKEGLLVSRFDRRRAGDAGAIERCHQEDGCQILDRYPADKYRIAAQEIMAGIDAQASAPIVEKLRFLELYAFSYLIGNGDLHARNVSLRRSPASGLIELAPAYDLLSTQAYRGLDQRMAMKLGLKDDEFRARDFIDFGRRNGLAEPAVRKMLARLVARSEPFPDRLVEIGLPAADRDRVARALVERRERLRP
ncbi:MAG: HipA domain-containing protein [Planctomycetes bacterium]|nr:HipA domain-containing protein [Planctomycetota bacterium]